MAVGWLAVALSMAAIGSASVTRIGGFASEPQTQITVMRSIDTGNSDASPAPGTDTSMSVATLTQPGPRTVSIAAAPKPVTTVRTTAALISPKTSSATPQPASATTVTAAPVVTVPVVVVGSEPTTVSTPAAATPTPTKTRPGKNNSTKHPYANQSASANQTASTSPVVAAASVATWQGAVGAIKAACQGTALASVQLKASDGYGATQRTSQVRSAITFDGPCTVSVRVTCSDGTPSFEVRD